MAGCNDYGIVSGCDLNCPFLWDGECEAIEDVLDCCDMDESQEKDLREIYKGVLD